MEASRQNNVKKIVDLTNTNKSPLSKEAKAKFEVSFIIILRIFFNEDLMNLFNMLLDNSIEINAITNVKKRLY